MYELEVTYEKTLSDEEKLSLDEKRLCEQVIKKHKAMLNEYSREFDILRKGYSELMGNIDERENRKLFIKNRVYLLREKIDQVSYWLRLSKEERDRLKSEKEEALKKSEKSDVSSLDENIKEAEKQIEKYTLDIEADKKELKEITEEEKGYESTDNGEEEDQMRDTKWKYTWLERRIKSHEDALEYWSGRYKNINREN